MCRAPICVVLVQGLPERPRKAHTLAFCVGKSDDLASQHELKHSAGLTLGTATNLLSHHLLVKLSIVALDHARLLSAAFVLHKRHRRAVLFLVDEDIARQTI